MQTEPLSSRRGPRHDSFWAATNAAQLQANVLSLCSPHLFKGFPGDKESSSQCRRGTRCGFDPWFGKIPWRREWQPTPVFLPGESHGQRSLASTVHGAAESQTQLRAHACAHAQTYRIYLARRNNLWWKLYLSSHLGVY